MSSSASTTAATAASARKPPNPTIQHLFFERFPNWKQFVVWAIVSLPFVYYALPSTFLALFVGVKLTIALYDAWALPIGQPDKANRHNGAGSRAAAHDVLANFASIAPSQSPRVVVIGSSSAGLSMAAYLQKERIPYVVLERNPSAGHSWRSRYERLHIHTTKATSSLPFFPFPKLFPEYPSKNDLAKYYDSVATMLNVKCNCNVTAVSQENGQYKVEFDDKETGANQTLVVPVVILAVGQEGGERNIPEFRDQAKFKGKILHSSAYSSGADFAGSNVLVVGGGNSGTEIAVDLFEYGAKPVLVNRSPLALIPRWFTRILIKLYGYLWFVMRLDDPKNSDLMIQKLLYPLAYKDLAQHGIQLPLTGEGPVMHYVRTHQAPMQDIGFIDLVRRGEVKYVHGEIKHFTETGVVLTNNVEYAVDAVVLATGFKMGALAFFSFLSKPLLQGLEGQKYFESGTELPNRKGLYLVGISDFFGRLFEMGLEASLITADLKAKNYV